MSADFLPDFTGYTFRPLDGAILNPMGLVVARVACNDPGILFGYALANVFGAAALVKAAPALLSNLETMTDLAVRYGVENDCDGNVIEAREAITAASVPSPCVIADRPR